MYNKDYKRIIGLDPGAASVGWAVVDLYEDENETTGNIVATGVRLFPIAQNPKDGESLNKARREARGARRCLRRKARRIDRIRHLFIEVGLLDSNYWNPTTKEIDLEKFHKELHCTSKKTPWQLRYDALHRKLESHEWAIVLTHLAKRRGFHSNSKREELPDSASSKEDKAKKQETLKMLGGVATNAKALREGTYDTVGDMFFRDPRFKDKKRNKAGDYSHTVSRADVQHEIETLFEHQRQRGNKYADGCFEKRYIKLWGAQRSYDAGNIEEMVGACTFEPQEKRAPAMSYAAERFRLFQALNNLRILDRNGVEVTLSDPERMRLAALAYKQTKVTYAQIRKEIALPEGDEFILQRKRKKKKKGGTVLTAEEERKEQEKDTFIELKGWHALRKAISDRASTAAWEHIKQQPEDIDTIITALTYYKTDENVRIYLNEHLATALDEAVIEAALHVDASKFVHLSLKALRKIIPYLEAGLTYDKACGKAGYDFQKPIKPRPSLKLPPIDADEIRNPVVLRALTQMRKVLNAILKEYGAPHVVHIELLRDIANSFEDRKKISAGQEQYRKEKESVVAQFREIYECDPKKDDLLKFRLCKEQKNICPYSEKNFDSHRLCEPGYAEIDHILPYSRSMDNSMANKVLCLTHTNREKGARIPYEYLYNEAKPERWHEFENRVQHYRKPKQKRLLRTSFTLEEAAEYRNRFVERPESKWIARYCQEWLKEHLAFLPSDIKQQVQTRNGTLTSFLRARWGLIKLRSESDTHHALDAVVTACATQGMVARLAAHSRQNELYVETHDPQNGYALVDTRSGEIKGAYQEHRDDRWCFPFPWPSFREDLQTKLEEIFVSRAARHTIGGEAHAATIQSLPKNKMSQQLTDEEAHAATSQSESENEGVRFKRVALSALSLSALENLVEKEGMNKKLYEEIKKRLKAHDGKGDKAFAEPLYHPSIKSHPIVRRVKIREHSASGSGIPVRGGIAENGGMIRVDVFCKEGKYFLVPIYVHHRLSDTLPDRAIVSGKPEGEWVRMDSSYQFLFSLLTMMWWSLSVKRIASRSKVIT